MTFTDSVFLGSTLVEPKQFSSSGCISTMALKAVGIDTENELYLYERVRDLWPWLRRESELSICGCNLRSKPLSYGLDLLSQFMHAYDFHCFGGGWTFEKLLDEIRALDPGDEALLNDGFTSEQIDELAAVLGVYDFTPEYQAVKRLLEETDGA